LNPNHHLDRSRRYLDFVPRNIAAGDYARGAKALARSASHAVTAAAVHWHHDHHSRRRLTNVLTDLVFSGRIAYAHLSTFRDVYRLLEQVADATPQRAGQAVGRMRRRVSRLIAAIAAAIGSEPCVPTLEQILADPTLLPDPDPAPQVTTIGELKDALGEYVDTQYRSHPIDCPGCRINYHGPIPARAV
jgi:hypothetical protein